MKLITREIDYAVRALKYLAEKGKEKVPVTELVEELGITRPMLRKIMQELAKNDTVISYKGNSGGFVLNKKPDDIYLIDLVEVFQGKFSMNECVQHKEICPNRETCLLRGKIEGIEADVKRKLESIDLESLLDKKGN
jgi:Rrf2 family nitric oxide-sensitive transcriptional repressor